MIKAEIEITKVVKLSMSREDAEWLTSFLASPGLHKEQDDEDKRRAFFHALNSNLYPHHAPAH